MTSSDFIAIGAAVISLFALFISWRAYKRDAGKLKLFSESEATAFYMPTLSLRIVNAGRRPVTLKDISYYKETKWFLWLSKRELLFGSAIPLSERENDGKGKRISIKLEEGQEYSNTPNSFFQTDYAIVRDTLGNKYRCSLKKDRLKLEGQGHRPKPNDEKSTIQN